LQEEGKNEEHAELTERDHQRGHVARGEATDGEEGWINQDLSPRAGPGAFVAPEDHQAEDPDGGGEGHG
jgi:hypothetical protein